MYKTVIALMVAFCATGAYAQWVEHVIDVPSTSTGTDALCYVPTVHKVYCCSESTDCLSVIDAVSNTLIGSIPVGDRPFAMCYNPINDRVYLANLASNNVMVIDPSSDSVIATVAVGESPYELCHNAPKNKIYVANYSGGSVSIINGTTDSLIYTVSDVGTRFICCNSTGMKVYTAKDGQGYVINCRFDMKWDSFPAGSTVHDMMYAPGLDKVYMTEYSGNAVWVIDAAADTLIRTVVVGNTTEGLCYNPHDNKVYCSVVSQSRVMVLDGNGDTLIAVVNVGTNPRAICYDSVHNKIYCTNEGDSVVHIISGAADSVVAVCATGMGPVALAWAPDLNKVFVANYQGRSVAVIRDTTPASVEEPTRASSGHARQLPTVLLGPTPAALDGATLRDIAGRKAAVLRQGVDCTALLRPGVYLARTAGGRTAKVLVVR